MNYLSIDLRVKFNLADMRIAMDEQDQLEYDLILSDPNFESKMIEDLVDYLKDEFGPEVEDGLVELSCLGSWLR